MDSYTFSSDSTSSFFVKETSSDESNLLAPGHSSFLHISSKEELCPQSDDSNVKEIIKDSTTANLSFGSDFKDDPSNMNASDIFIITINENHSNDVENNSKINIEVPEMNKTELSTENVKSEGPQEAVTDLFTPDTGLSELLLSDTKETSDYQDGLQLGGASDDKGAETFDMEHFLSFKRDKATKSPKEPNKSVGVIKKYFTHVGSNMVQCNLCSDRLVNNTSNLLLHLRLVHRSNKKPNSSQKLTGSKVWNFFTKIDPFKAKCNLCSNLLIFKNRVSNLTKHLRVVHKQVLESNGSVEKSIDKGTTEECKTVNEEVKTPSPSKDVIVIQTPKGKLLNQIKVETEKSWKCFTKAPNSNNMICNLCKMILAPNVLLNHLRAQHKSILSATGFIQSTVSDPKVEAKETDSSKENKSTGDNLRTSTPVDPKITDVIEKVNSAEEKSSVNSHENILVHKTTGNKKRPANNHPVWNYFKDLKSGKVSCNTCKSILMCNFSTSNMLRHLKCLHIDIYNIVKGIDTTGQNTGKKTQTEPEQLNHFLKYFTKVKKMGKTFKVRCNVCKVLMTYSRSLSANLKRHLRAKHGHLFSGSNTDDIRYKKELNLMDKDVGKTGSIKSKSDLNNEYTNFENSDTELLEYELVTTPNKSQSPRKTAISEEDTKRVFQTSNAWNYFTKSEIGENKVICNICSVELEYRKDSLYNLFCHISSKHNITFNKIPRPEKVFVYVSDEESTDGKKSTKKVETGSNRKDEGRDHLIDVKGSSRTWKHFTKLDRDKAKCNICSKVFTYKLGQISNLDKHIQSHNKTENKKRVKDQIGRDKEDKTLKDVDGKSDVWNFYTKLEYNEAMCNLCKIPNIVNYTEHSKSNLRRHLRRQHKYSLAKVENESESSSSSEDDESEDNKRTAVKKGKVAAAVNDVPITNVKMLFDYLMSDDKLQNCIKFENDLIKCKICSGTFSCDDLIKCESTIRYHVQIFHAEWTVNCFENSSIKEECPSPTSDQDPLHLIDGPTERNVPIYNELEAIANEVTSFIESKDISPQGLKQNITKNKETKVVKPERKKVVTQEEYHQMLNDNLWKYFTKLTSENVRCNFCMIVLSFRQNKKWNLLRHIKLKHRTKVFETDSTNFSKMHSEIEATEKRFGKTRTTYTSNKRRITAKKKSASKTKNKIDKKIDSSNETETKLEETKDTNEKKPLPPINSPSNRKFGRTWSHFTKIEMGSAQCNICGSVLFYRGNGIDTLNEHLSSNHTGYFDGSEQVDERKSYFKTSTSELNDDIDSDKESISNSNKSDSDHEYLDDEDKDKSWVDTTKSNKSEIKDSEDTENGCISTKKQPSPVWRYFDRFDDGYAKCHLCLSGISFKGTTSNLFRHLQKVHSVISLPVENDSESVVNKVESEKSLLLAAVNLTPTKVVNEGQLCYIRVDKKSATCQFCQRIVHHKYGNMHKLMSHLLHKHRNDISEYKTLKHLKFLVQGKEISLIVRERRNRLATHLIDNCGRSLDKVDKRKIYRSNTWLYFTKLNDEHAKCNKCFNTFSYKGGSIYNLTRHLLIKHEVKLIKRKEMSHKKLMSLNTPTARSSTISKKKETLLFFKRVNGNIIKCKLCLKRFVYNGKYISHLVNHLWSTHISKFVGSDSNVISSNRSDTSDNGDDNDDHNVGNNSLPQTEDASDGPTQSFQGQVDSSKAEEGNAGNNCEETTTSNNFNIFCNRGNRFTGIWKYYTDLKDTECNVQCNICQKMFCFRSRNLSNLSRHLEIHNIRRPYIKTEIKNESNKVDDDANKNLIKTDVKEDQALPITVAYIKENKLSKDMNNLFIFFTRLSDSMKVQCKICSEDVEYCGGTDDVETLKRHLSMKHDITGYFSNQISSNITPEYDHKDDAQLEKDSNVLKTNCNASKKVKKLSKMKCKLCYKVFVLPKNKIKAKLIQHLKVDHNLPDSEKELLNELSLDKDECYNINVIKSVVNEIVENCLPESERQLLDESSKDKDECNHTNVEKSVINVIMENGLPESEKRLVDDLSNCKEKSYVSTEPNFVVEGNIDYKIVNSALENGKEILDGLSKIVPEFEISKESNSVNLHVAIENGLPEVEKQILKVELPVRVDKEGTINEYHNDQVSDKTNKKVDCKLKVNRTLSLYYKNFKNHKNKCKVCNKFISIKRPCFHRITNDLCMKYGVRKRRQKRHSGLVTNRNKIFNGSKEKTPVQTKSRLEHFMSVNLHENKCFKCMELWHDGVCLHSLNSWILSESKKKSAVAKPETSDYNAVLTDKEVQMITDTLGDCSDNIIIITNDENDLNYDLSANDGDVHRDISYQIMNSINDIDDEDVRVIIYDYNAENVADNDEETTVKIQEITEVESDATLINGDVSPNKALEDNLKEFVIQLSKPEQVQNNDEAVTIKSAPKEEEKDTHVNPKAEIKEDSSVSTHTSKLTELAEVSCNEQFYKQSSLSNQQSDDLDVTSKSDTLDKCIVETIYHEDNNDSDIADADKKLVTEDKNITMRQELIVVENNDDTKVYDSKTDVSCDDNTESCVIHVPENIEEIEPFKQELRDKHNEVLSEEVINAIFNEFTVNFQNNDDNDVKCIKIVDNIINMPTDLYFQDLVSSYKISKSVLHFDNIDYEYKIAKCNLCDTYLQFMEPIIYNLLMHLFTHHKDKVCAEESINSDVTFDSKPAEVRNKGRRKSQVWKYFNNENNFRATCRICNFSFSFKGGAINNLSRHLRLRHNIVLSANMATPNLDGLITYPKRRSAVKLRSKTWMYFSKEPNDWARCKICNKYLSYRSSTINNLTRHLRTVHAKIFNCLFNDTGPVFIKNEDGSLSENANVNSCNSNPQDSLFDSSNGKTRDEILQRCSYPSMENHPSKRKSIVWNYFTEFSPNLGKCNFCMKVISCKGGGTSNLSRHLRSRHGIWIVLTSNLTQSFNELNQSELITTSELQGNPDMETIITQEQLHILKNRKVVHKKNKTWEYFTKESSDRVRCNLCGKALSYKCKAVHNLRRHLSKKHPESVAKPEPVRLKLQINTDNVLHNENAVEDSAEDDKKFIDITDTSVVIVDEESHLPPSRPDRNLCRPKKSIVWNYFKEIEYGVAKCVICAKVLSFRGGGTNNLMRHLRCRHAIIIINQNNAMQNGLDQESTVYYASEEMKQEIIEVENNTESNVVIFESDQIECVESEIC